MLTEKQIQFLNRVFPNTWTEENDIISVNESVNICNMNLTKIPVKFGQVNGNFDCNSNKLTSLYNIPPVITGFFNCSHNKLVNLKEGPYKVHSYFACSNNKLTSLKGCLSIVHSFFSCNYNNLKNLKNGPKEVGRDYSCYSNLLTNLIGAPKICNSDFFCSNNQLTSLEGCPRIIKKDLYCTRNPNLHILYGIGKIEGNICYDNKNDLNEWIIQQAKHDIFVTYADIAKWIKDNNKFKFLLNAQQEIREHFSPRILHLVDMGSYHNESKILNYTTFKKIC